LTANALFICRGITQSEKHDMSMVSPNLELVNMTNVIIDHGYLFFSHIKLEFDLHIKCSLLFCSDLLIQRICFLYPFSGSCKGVLKPLINVKIVAFWASEI
jgi:hypothetical protein